MKKKWIKLIVLVTSLTIIMISASLLFHDYLFSRSFDEVWGAEGGIEVTIQPKGTLSYGFMPPPMDGDGKAWKEPFTDEIIALLEGHRYRKSVASAPIDGGMIFERWDGCMVSEPAYWDGKHLWIASHEGWLPYNPSMGFKNEMENLLNARLEFYNKIGADSNG